ncbi:hypothetical protein AB0O76_17870 [Streptomyces sp. NPDC086554]|uniref:hypothetical protein n=1 Tax=Streptomyces sp. NPDC086554 TaxID=3154864 RepID=UPI0034285F34
MPQGGRIGDHTDADLLTLASWLLSDGYQLDRDTRIGQALTELGFKRCGRILTERLTHAFEQAQHTTDREQKR